jgi:predicted DNA-binding transcriptional regulator AlpA
MDDTFLTSTQLAQLLKRKPQTIRAWRLRGHGPKYIRLGNGPKAPVAYRRTDIEEWLDERTYKHTAEEQAI